MASTIPQPQSSASLANNRHSTIASKTSAPFKLWSLFGVIVIAMISYSLWQWFTSDHFRPASVGLDPLPAGRIYLLRGLEIFAVCSASVLIWFTIINPLRKTGELSWDGMLCIVGLTMWYQDPIDNYFNFTISYNAYFINMTSWATYIPGWESPRQENFPEPLLLLSSMYMLFMCGMAILGCWIINKSKTNWFPRSSNFVHLSMVFICLGIIDFVVEGTFCRLEIFGYGGTYHPLTLWAGNYYQFPIYESFCVAAITTSMTALRYFRDDKGYSYAERGVHQLKLSRRGKKCVSFLALLGFCHAAFFVVFFFPYNWLAMKADSYPKMSSYMLYEVCGEGTPYACPSREVPIPSKGSLAISPDDPRLSEAAKAN